MAKEETMPWEMHKHAIKILDRIWTQSRKRTAAKSKRKNLFNERDTVDAKIDELEDKSSDEGLKLSLKWREIVKAIDKLALEIEFYSDAIEEAIDDAIQGKFEFLDADIGPPKKLYDKLKPKKAEEPAPKKDGRPVGVPGPDRQTMKLVLEGVDEHLNAAVSELDTLSDRDRDKLTNAGFTTIGEVAKVIDVDGGTLGQLMDKLNCGQEIASRIKKAVGSFRKKHRSAKAEVEREEREG